jgi:hypothetical protein
LDLAKNQASTQVDEQPDAETQTTGEQSIGFVPTPEPSQNEVPSETVQPVRGPPKVSEAPAILSGIKPHTAQSPAVQTRRSRLFQAAAGPIAQRSEPVNFPRSHTARPRFGSARWPAAHAPTANQLTRQDDSRPDRPLIQGVRSASVPASIAGFTGDRPASFPLHTPALDALIGDRRAGSLGLRPLAPLPFTAAPNQRKTADPLGFARPFPPSSPPDTRLRASRNQRKGRPAERTHSGTRRRGAEPRK